MKVYRIISATCVIIGCVIGAGFATGREILVFFGGKNAIVSASLCCVGFFLLFNLYFSFAKRYSCYTYIDLFKKIFGRAQTVVDVIVSGCYLLISATMIAASGTCLKGLFTSSLSPTLLSLVTMCLCVFFLVRGKRGLQIANVLSVPLIIAILIYFCLVDDTLMLDGVGCGKFFSYCSFNALLSCGVMLPLASDLSKKECAVVSVLSAIVLSLLILLVLLRINSPRYLEVEMPIALFISKQGSSAITLYYALLYFAVFTTLCANVFSCCQRITCTQNTTYKVAIVLVIAFTISLFGFAKIVDYAYPVISFLSVLTTAFLIVLEFTTKCKTAVRTKY